MERKKHAGVSPETQTVQGLHYCDPASGSVMPPVYPSTTYARSADNALINPDSIYTRDQNPTYELPQAMLAKLEGGEQALLFSSGMAAASAVFRSLRPGDHAVIPEGVYYGLRDWVMRFAADWGLSISHYAPSNPDGILQALEARQNTALVWVETPTNPMWEITDIRKAADLAHAYGAVLAVDSTVATPVHTRPIEYGADIVMHSATKSLNGHSDVLAGALITADSQSQLWQRIATERGDTGSIPGPFEAWLLQRGLRTLFVRVARASSNAMAIAERLEHHPALSSVLYPGLASAPGHAIAAAQMQDGFGALLSLRFKGGRSAALRVLAKLTLFTRATSLGGVESLVEHRASAEGETSTVPDDLLRFSIGIERCEDLIDDLEAALATLTDQ